MNCEQTQYLISKSERQNLSFVEKAKVSVHTSMCTACNESKIRSKLLVQFKNQNEHTQLVQNPYLSEVFEKSKSMQLRLASFPEQNPSPIIEIELSGVVSYQNPAFISIIDKVDSLETYEQYWAGFKKKFDDLIHKRISSLNEETIIKGIHYIKRANFIESLQVVRIFYLDISDQKKFEKIITQKNEEITSSIQYAKRIQQAILPSSSFFLSKFKESFIFYEPKDIVAGDFYWMVEKDEFVFVAAADCTGHGVPGAFVSIICNNALNRSVHEFNCKTSAEILNKTRALVIETFSNNGNNVKDGMDISLICWNTLSNEVTWSGANNPLWVFSNGAINETKADKQTVGIVDKLLPYTNHTIQINKNDFIFLFTDGYADQFGGYDDKKLKYKVMKSLIEDNDHVSAIEMYNILSNYFQNWKGETEQTDDVLVIGIKF